MDQDNSIGSTDSPMPADEIETSQELDIKGQKEVTKRASKIFRAEKERQAVELRKAGVTYEQIARSIGYSNASAASKAVRRALRRIKTESPAELKTLMVEQLRTLLLSIWETAVDKQNPGHLAALDRAQSLIGQIAKIEGIEHAPTVATVQQNMTNNTVIIQGSKEEFISSLRDLAEKQGSLPDGMKSISSKKTVIESKIAPDDEYE